MKVMDLGPLPVDLHPSYGTPLNNDEDGAVYSCALHEASNALEAYCFFPDDEHGRKGFLATMGAIAYDKYEQRDFPLLEGFEQESAQFWKNETAENRKQWLDRHGGLSALATNGGMRAIKTHVESTLEAVFWTGRLGTLIYNLDGAHKDSIRGGASLNKAVGLIAKTGGPKEDTLKAAWRKYSSVAHIISALDYWRFSQKLEDSFDEPGDLFAPARYMTASTLFVARFYQEFFTNFVPRHGRKLPLIDPSEIWSLPDQIAFHPSLIRPLRINDDDLAVVQSYRAPVPSQ